ncbi:MAG: N-6 DNA methylase [Bacteroidota bacterium]
MGATKRQFQLNKAIEGFMESQSDDLQSEDLAYINQYTGYGGMWAFDAGLSSTPSRGLYEYYTPIEVVEKMVGLAYKYGFKQGKVLEPSCGIGRFLHYFPPNRDIVGIEPDKTSLAIAKANFPGIRLLNQTFNECFVNRKGQKKETQTWLNQFDLVIGNPPYGTFSGRFTAQEKKSLQVKTYVEYFILRGLMCLKKGGLLIYVIPSLRPPKPSQPFSGRRHRDHPVLQWLHR